LNYVGQLKLPRSKAIWVLTGVCFANKIVSDPEGRGIKPMAISLRLNIQWCRTFLTIIIITMNFYPKLLLSLSLLAFYACGSDSDSDSEINQKPENFSVTVSDVTNSTAILTWSTATDADGDLVTYNVTIGESNVATGLSVTSISLSGLSQLTDYSGTVLANDGKGGESSASYSFTTIEEDNSSNYLIDPTLFTSSSFIVDAKLVDCTLENGSITKCYELTFISNPVNDDGPFCPSTINDIGGMGIYDGPTNNSGNSQGFQVMKASLFNDMENDGYDIVDVNGNINISDFSGQDNKNFAYCLHPLADDNLVLKFTIPAIPENLNNVNTIEAVELIGVSVDGVPMNGDPPSVTTGQMGNGNIPSLDACGGHADPSGYYHWHFIPESISEILDEFGLSTDISCTNITQDNTSLSGFAKDGYPIYASRDMDGSLPTNLDNCNGHTSATNEYPDGVYHYHASSTQAPNMPPCLIGAAVSNPFTVN